MTWKSQTEHVYTLLMHGDIPEAEFFDRLMRTDWFPETVTLYFGSRYREKYDEVLSGLIRHGAVRREQELLKTTVRP